MLYQLPTGKVIELPTEIFCFMEDEDFQYQIACNNGLFIEDPFSISVLYYGPYKIEEDIDKEYLEEECLGLNDEDFLIEEDCGLDIDSSDAVGIIIQL